MERVTGIEPVSLAWKARVLPLHNARAVPVGIRTGSVRQGTTRTQAAPACPGDYSQATEKGGRRTFVLCSTEGFGTGFRRRTGKPPRVRLARATSDSTTGASTKTPTTLASAAPESRPRSPMATATASSRKSAGPISAQGAGRSHLVGQLPRKSPDIAKREDAVGLDDDRHGDQGDRQRPGDGDRPRKPNGSTTVSKCPRTAAGLMRAVNASTDRPARRARAASPHRRSAG